MGDLLEKYVIDHRQEFDDLDPSENLWGSIKKNLNPVERTGTDRSWIWKVAAVVFLASTIALVIERQMDMGTSEETIAKQEFYEAESYYFHQINQKKKELSDLGIKDKNYDLLVEEQYLDGYYQELKKDYFGKMNNDQVKDAMIQNLRMRIRILNDQIKILSESKRHSIDENNIEM
ncbi:hypothetical protein [Marinoscillum sp. MHG1-6]|uniref:hypothetical protein n=1 Tax=Marinoscillum sp. MHG1-6 TaxID=2959627 RepID=UPI0021570AF3|nr:hypothetical protein [Marinoscillum sp. MHG1-6]